MLATTSSVSARAELTDSDKPSGLGGLDKDAPFASRIRLPTAVIAGMISQPVPEVVDVGTGALGQMDSEVCRAAVYL